MPFDDESLPFSFFLGPFFFFSFSARPSLFSSQELCKDLQRKTDTADDEQHDIEVKVARNEKELLVFVMEMNTSLTLCQNFFMKS